jgi:LacI family transcriptional regulator
MSRSVTSREVAQKAGVDQSTVSKILSGATNFSDKTIAHVKKVCEEMGYISDSRARSLRTGQSYAIAVHLPFGQRALLEDPFIPEFLAGVNSYASAEGYGTILTYPDENTGFSLLQVIKSRRADGLIITSPGTQDPSLDQLISENIPIVMGHYEGAKSKRTVCVDVDNFSTGLKAAAFLASRGHQQVGVITQTGTAAANDFIEGFGTRFHQTATDQSRLFTRSISISAKEARRAALALLAQDEPPTAIVTNLAVASFGLVEAVRDIPADIQLLAVDSPLFSELHSEICRIRVPTQALGSQMAQALIELLRNGKPAKSRMLQAEILDERGEIFSDHP